MSKMLLLIAATLLTACGSATNNSPSSEANKQARGDSSSAGQSSGGIDVKVTKNGASLAAFQTASTNAGEGAQLLGKNLSVELTSPDRKWVLTIEVPGAKAGAYHLAPLAKDGKAMIRLAGGEGDNVMMVAADNGELKLDEVSETSCSGSFKGTGSDAIGKNKYTYEGKFSKVRAFRQE